MFSHVPKIPEQFGVQLLVLYVKTDFKIISSAVSVYLTARSFSVALQRMLDVVKVVIQNG